MQSAGKERDKGEKSNGTIGTRNDREEGTERRGNGTKGGKERGEEGKEREVNNNLQFWQRFVK